MGEILVAIDGSIYSDPIIDYACDLARRLKEKIVLIYVSKNPDLVDEYIEYGERAPSPRAQKTVAIAESVTSKLSEKISSKGIEHRVILETGNPAEKIILTAAETKSDLIIVGLKGLHGMERIRSLGSVSRRVLENSPCPVVVLGRD